MSEANKKEAEGDTVIIIRIDADGGVSYHPKMENFPGVALGEPIALPGGRTSTNVTDILPRSGPALFVQTTKETRYIIVSSF